MGSIENTLTTTIITSTSTTSRITTGISIYYAILGALPA